MPCPIVQLLHRFALPTGVPFFTFNLPMTLRFLSGLAGKFLAGEQAATDFLRRATTALPEFAFRAGFEPATSGLSGEVTVAYATGQGGCLGALTVQPRRTQVLAAADA